MYREAYPLLPEPARFVGARACTPCHSAIYQTQQKSRHARTFARGTELAGLELPSSPFSEPAAAHALAHAAGGRLEQTTKVAGRVFHAVVDYAFGSGDRGLTLVGRDDRGQARELRLSRYHLGPSAGWDVTSGQHESPPASAPDYLGRPLTEDLVRRCLLCHVTEPQAILALGGPVAADRGIGCEKCHGPGGNHLLAVAAKLPDLAIARPSLASGMKIVELCAQCHSPRGRMVSPDEPTSVRFQASTLCWSRCFTESNGRLDCLTCHNPHRDVETSAKHYESKCLECHGGLGAASTAGAKAPRNRDDLAQAALAKTCPVDAKQGCIGCHMPSVKNVVPHSEFTDHFIRVHRD